MPTAIALLVALLVMAVVYEMTPTATRARLTQFDRIRALTPEEDRKVALWQAILQPLLPYVNRWTPAGWRETVRRWLYWANFDGSWLGWNEIEFWALSFALSVVSFAFFLTVDVLVAVIAAGFGLLAPALLLRSTARKIERALARELPDALYLLAAMLAVGLSLPDAFRRLAEYRGRFARWIGFVQSQSHGGDLVAVLRAEASRTGHARLIGFATKLDLIETKGEAHSADLLRRLADDQVRDYSADASKRAKELGSSLVFPILGLFFFPYLVVIAAPLFANMLTLFAAK